MPSRTAEHRTLPANGKALSAILLVLFATGCEREEPVVPPEIIRPVRVQRVTPAASSRSRVFSGTAKPGVESSLSFRVRGIILELGVKVGDRIAAGTLIARLDPTDFELNVQVTEAALQQSRAQLENANASLVRTRNLFENDNASQSDYDTVRTARDTAAATVQSAERQVELSRQQLKYTRLVAPTEGAISEVPVEVNENVTAGQAVAVLTSGIRPEVEVAIPEQYIAQIERGSRVEVSFDALGRTKDATRAARVIEVGVSASQFASTFPVKVQLDQRDSRILPGMAAEVRFDFPSEAGKRVRYLLPTHSVGEDKEGRFVYVVQPAEDGMGTVERRPVRVGDLVSPTSLRKDLRGMIEVLDGLASGDAVVTAGLTRVQPGMTVRLIDDTDR